MSSNDITSISALDVRTTIIDYLQQRLSNNNNYKSTKTTLAKAQDDNNLSAIQEAEASIAELEQRFAFDNWMEEAFTRRIFWIKIATNISKGIHSSSQGSNVNYCTQVKPQDQPFVSSATPKTLPFDCTGNAAALDIFNLLNQEIKNGETLLSLVLQDSPIIVQALSDDSAKAEQYLAYLKQIIYDDFDHAKASELNKQFYWPIREENNSTASIEDYHLLIPLHPSSLCHVVYQKIQQRFAEQNKTAREQRYKKNDDQQPYFSFHDLAIVKLGGSNPQGVSQLVSRQGGSNFLLPSVPPQFSSNGLIKISKRQQTIFDKNLEYRCKKGFMALFEVVKTPRNNKFIRDKRKDRAFDEILAQLLITASQIQITYPAGWSKDYKLNINQKYWLDPQRAELAEEADFAQTRQEDNWIDNLALQFAFWINGILRKQFKDRSHEFDDAEIYEWQREFHDAVKASQRKREGIF